MLFPRFSIRSLIALTFVAALCAYSIARALRGDEWAVAVAVTIGAVAVCLLCFGVLFAASWAFGSLVTLAFASPRSGRPLAGGPFAPHGQGSAGSNNARSTSPFAEVDRLPPQVIPDREVPLE